MAPIFYFVPMIPQGDNPICWIACVAMITSFKTRATHPISEFTGGYDPSNSCIPDPNVGWEDLYANLDKFGFTAAGANQSLSPSVIEDTLRRRGPFMIFVESGDFPFYGPMCSNEGGTHAMVVNGIGTPVGKVSIVNPWGTPTAPVDADIIVRLMQDISSQGLNSFAYMR
jgi:hypothetical protein